MNPQYARPKVVGKSVSPAALNLAEWFRQVDRLVRTSRTYGPGNPLVVQTRERAAEAMVDLLRYHAPLAIRITPLEIWLLDELVVKPHRADDGGPGMDRRLPFLFYRDGVRGLTFSPETRPEEIRSLLAALSHVAGAGSASEDLVTLLWEAELFGLRVDVAPLDQAIIVRGADPDSNAPGAAGAGAWLEDSGLLSTVDETPEAGGETLATFDDWAVPERSCDPLEAWRVLEQDESEQLRDWLAAWREERSQPWRNQVPGLVRQALAAENSGDMREALGASLVTWLAAAIERCDWPEVWRAFESLRGADPEGEDTRGALIAGLSGIDAQAVAERLDESDSEAQSRFFALTVQLGLPALDLVVGVLANANRPRLRAAATTALCYTCADDPSPLARHLADGRWHVVRNIVFVLGQIGGEEVADLLAMAARHLDARVRRAVVASLGQVPVHRSLPLLLSQLATVDPQLLTTVLNMLNRQRDPRVTRALLDRVNAVDFEKQPDEIKTMLLVALGDLADEGELPTLESILLKGGWLARRTPERTAAAHTLARVGTPAALKILNAALRSRAVAVRTACEEALGQNPGRAA